MSTESSGFWLPRKLYLIKELTMMEKLLFVEIQSLSMLDKGCVASNKHFATLLDIKREAVSRSLNRLKAKGFISIDIKNRNHDRKITINKMLSPINKMVTGDNNLLSDPLTKCLESKENNSVLNNSVNKRQTITISLEDREESFKQNVLKHGDDLPMDMLNDFIDYWTEPDKREKMKFEKCSTWDTKRRLNRWNKNNFNKPKEVDHFAGLFDFKKEKK